MPPQFPARLDERRLEEARNRLCEVFGVPALRDHQEKAGQNIMLGKTTLYDVPTGGGKTLAFWYPLFYHLAQGGDCQKVVLVVSPLNALMNSQAKDLADRGISAVALNSEGGDIEDLFEKDSSSHGRLKYRVIFVSPEMALTRRFHQRVLKDKGFGNNCIELVIDEAHCVTEWGENFREEYAELSQLLARLPSGLPVLLASATMPPDVTQDIVFKLGLPLDCPRVAVSNAKLNVALSVRVMQHPQKTYADLLFLLPADPTSIIQELPQTLIYVNSRSEAEEIQDFLRRHCPQDIKPEAFIFYHRHIDSKDKLLIQEGLRSGSYRCVVATDALGMVSKLSVPINISRTDLLFMY
ncbi:P-loop containing nucleoside triphosphate hydrolase protein [Dendrothele bispora CBS 962.96]|uniref:DNA 3'-5' helicase n=1 Tax=Dendrothele bispora (strain CBS 962.96) TaxID=1314807 RepID=A0A4S8KLF6_DENBC|nr:P-loop containing nucleoside triphosphate hydrolase protein [Dendrothele bispora CBS 962.96]